MAREYAPSQLEVKRETLGNENKEQLSLKPAEIVRGAAVYVYNKALEEIYRTKDIINHAFFADKENHPFSNAMMVLTDIAVPRNLKDNIVNHWQRMISSHNWQTQTP